MRQVDLKGEFNEYESFGIWLPSRSIVRISGKFHVKYSFMATFFFAHEVFTNYSHTLFLRLKKLFSNKRGYPSGLEVSN